MQHELIDRNPDLQELCSEGYRLRVADDAFLVVGHVPYVTESQTVKRDELIFVLTIAPGNIVTRPADHVAFWAGEHPWRSNRKHLSALLPQGAGRQVLCPSFPSVLMFSAKASYRNYLHKVTTYVEILGSQARAVEPGVTAVQEK